MKRTLILVMIACLCPATFAQRRVRTTVQPSPEQLVADLYRQHKRHSPFFQKKNRALVDKYFDKALADLIWNIHDVPGEVGPLDGDPLYNAQDMEIKNFVIHNASVKDNEATVLVTFTNFGKRQEVKFLLVRPSGWKIQNIKYDDGTDLVMILKQG